MLSITSVVFAASLEKSKLLFSSSGVPLLVNIALNIRDLQFMIIAIIGAIRMLEKLIKAINRVGFTQTLKGLIQASKNFRFDPTVQANIKNSLQWGVITGFGIICLSSIAFLIWLVGAKLVAIGLVIGAIVCLLTIFIVVVNRYGLYGGFVSSIGFATTFLLVFCYFLHLYFVVLFYLS